MTDAVQSIPVEKIQYAHIDRSIAVPVLMSVFFVSETIIRRELHFAITIAMLICFVAIRPALIGRAIYYVIPLWIIVLVSSVVTIPFSSVGGFDSDNLYKGLFYITCSPIYFATGFLCFGVFRNKSAVFQAICLSSVIIACQWLFLYSSDPNLARELASGDRTYLRHTLGAGTNLWGLAIPLCLFAPSLIGRYRIFFQISVLSLVVLALYLSTGRTGWAWAMIVCATLLFGKVTQAFWFSATAFVLFFLFFCFLTPSFPFAFNYGSLAWVQKLPMFAESAPVLQENLSGINEHWRGFETFLAFRYVFAMGFPWQFIGTGLSSAVPIGFNFTLGGEVRQSLPIFHNGFSFLMVRAGFIGIILYITQMITWIQGFDSKYKDKMSRKVDSFAIGLIISLIFSTPTITGLYQQGDCKSIMPFIIGYLLSCHQYTRRRNLMSSQSLIRKKLSNTSML